MMTMKSSSFFITTSTHAVYLSEQRFEVSDTFRVTLRVRQIDFWYCDVGPLSLHF